MKPRSAGGGFRLERAIGGGLRIGVTASSFCLAVGMAAMFIVPASPLSTRLLTAGVLLLMATPAVRVVLSVIEYVRQREWLFVALTSIVLLELAASVAAAMYGWSLWW